MGGNLIMILGIKEHVCENTLYFIVNELVKLVPWFLSANSKYFGIMLKFWVRTV